MSTQPQTAAPLDDRSIEEDGGPFKSLYAHWEAHQWSPLDLDLSRDAQSFDALDSESKRGFIWIFAHRFHAEFNVASLLSPFLEHAPDWEMQLLIATQIADEHRHMQSVLRVYEEVFGVTGGIKAIRELADENLDVIATSCFEHLDTWVGKLATGQSEQDYVMAVLAYHVIAEGVVAKTGQNLAAGQYARYGEFPGLTEGQGHVSRDEARHIGIGVSYIRRALEQNPEVRGWVDWGLDEFANIAASLLETALASEMHQQVVDGYGVEPVGFYEEAIRLLQIRMRSVGYLDTDE